MPRKEPILGQKIGVSLGGVEHQFDDTLDMTIRRRQRANIQPEPSRDRTAFGATTFRGTGEVRKTKSYPRDSSPDISRSGPTK